MPAAVRAGFVTFEGVDGSGKTTASRLVAEALRARGETVFLTGEPTAHWIGEAVRHAYRDDVGPRAETFLFLADRAVHLTEIRRHLENGELVLCDRYQDSTYAYQGARFEGLVDRPVPFLMTVSQPWLLVPDLTLFLRVPPEVGLQRIAGRSDRIRFEDPVLLRRVAAIYDTLAKDPRFAVIDATRPMEDVVAEALAVIDRCLSLPSSR